MSVVAVIPARMGSKRLPGKVLADVGGVPMVAHVASRVMMAETIDRVVIATDSDQVSDVVRDLGVDVFRSTKEHATGSDRVAEAVGALDAAIVVNVQADNAFLSPDIVDSVVRCFDDSQVRVATPVSPFPAGMNPAESSKVKAVVGSDGRAKYFSRLPVPSGGPWWLHIGVYGFRAETLREFSSWARGSLEIAEDLEQLRFIENDVAIHVTQVAHSGVSIDTPADMANLSTSSISSGLQGSSRF